MLLYYSFSSIIRAYLFAYKPCEELMKLDFYSKYYEWLNSIRKTPYLEIIEGHQELRTYNNIPLDINNPKNIFYRRKRNRY